MKQEHLEVMRDLLMYLAGAIDTSIEGRMHAPLCYAREKLKIIYDENIKLNLDNQSQSLIPENYHAMSINELQLRRRTTNCLKSENIYFVGLLVKCSVNDLSKIPNLGRTALKEIKDALAEIGLSLSANDFLGTQQFNNELAHYLDLAAGINEGL